MKPQPVTKDAKLNNFSQQNQDFSKSGQYEVNLSADFQDLQETPQKLTSQKLENQQKLQAQEEANLKHYIIPGTMFEGQFTYVTKEKKQEDVERQLQELEDQKRQLAISTQHYINPTTVVQGQVQNAGKQHKNKEVQKQLNKIDQYNQQNQQSQQNKQNKQDQSSTGVQKPKVMQRVNRHEFNSNEVPQLHQQDIPVNLQPVQVNQNLFQAIQDPKMKSIKPLQPVKLENSKQKSSNIPTLKPASLAHPLQASSKELKKQEKKRKPQQEQRHYIIPGTCFQGQFEYVTKQKKQEDVQRQLRQLDGEKRQLQISTQHYVKPTTIVEGQVHKAQKQQKRQIIQNQIKEVQKKIIQPNMPISHKYQQKDRSSLLKSQFSQADTEGLKLLKENSKDKKFIRMQIQSDQKGNLPYKIDQYTCMTVRSSELEERPSLNLPFSEQPNDDVEIIVIQTSLNKQATSAKDLVNQNPKDVLGNGNMQSIIDSIKNRDGSPVKVVISTKQFANYPGQSTPSPSIIDEATLSEFRKKNHSQFLQKNTQIHEGEAIYFDTKNSEEGNPEEVQMNRINVKEKNTEIVNGKEKLEVQHLHVTIDVDKVKKVNQDGKKNKPIFSKIIKSAFFSSLVGGLVWLSLEDKKIAAISAATGFAVALMIQK